MLDRERFSYSFFASSIRCCYNCPLNRTIYMCWFTKCNCRIFYNSKRFTALARFNPMHTYINPPLTIILFNSIIFGNKDAITIVSLFGFDCLAGWILIFAFAFSIIERSSALRAMTYSFTFYVL